MRAYLKPLCLVFETNTLVPAQFDGFSFGPFVFVRPGTTPSLIAHEQAHVRQFWRWLGLNGLVYKLSPKWRLRFEVEAYRAQLAVAGAEHAPHLANALATEYGLDLSEADALTLLTN